MLPLYDRDIPSVRDVTAPREKSSVRVQSARGGAGGRGAVELVAQCVDPHTGHVDTFRIALWVSDAGRRDFALAAHAYSAIEAHLLARSPGDLARFNQDLVEAMRACARPGKRRQLVHNPVLAREWGPSAGEPPARQAGSPGLRALLESHGVLVPAIDSPPSRPVPRLASGMGARDIEG
jgi:hypothetical protein